MSGFQIDPAYVVSSIIGLVVWFTRLEAKTSRNEKDIAKMQDKHDNLEAKLITDLNDVKLALARIEGQMGIKKE